MKRFFLSFNLIFTLLFSINYDINAQIASLKKGSEVKTVIIDAGHGGQDPGAVSGNVREKDVALAVALLLGEKIKNFYPDMKIVYTRKSDVFVELYKRAEIADKNNGDLFISIHCNSATNTTASGAETWVMGLGKNDKHAEEALKAENAVILNEKNYQDNYEGYNPNENPYSAENYIIFKSFIEKTNENQRLSLAQKIQDQYVKNLGIKDRGVKQGPFLVLWKVATMPSILTELGFVSNAQDRAYLNSTKGQEELATAIFNAFSAYKSEVEKDNVNNSIKNSNQEKVEDVNNEIVDQPSTKNAKKNVADHKNDTKKANTEANSNKNDKPSSDVLYKVQFFTSAEKINVKDSKFSKLKDVNSYLQDGKYKYTAGSFKTEQEARKYREDVVKYGFKDAFIVKFKDGKRLN